MTRHRSAVAVAVVVAVAVALAPLAASVPASAAASSQPSPPAAYYGDVSVNGEPAPAGVPVAAVVNGSVKATIETDADGSFGEASMLGEKLTVNASSGQNVTLRVGDVPVRNVTWESGDLRELSLSVSDDEPPAAAVDAPSQVSVGTTVELDAAASTDDVAVVDYEWRFPDGSTASGETATVTFDSPGEQTVDLTVVDAGGNTDSVTTAVTVTGDAEGPADGEGPGAGGPGDGGPGADDPGAPGDTPASNESAVSVVVTPDAVNVSLTGVQPNETVNVTLPTTGPSNGSGVAVDGLGVAAADAVDVNLGVTVGDEPGADVPAPGGADDDGEVSDTVAYVTVEEDVDEDSLASVTFEFSVAASSLAERGAAPSEVSMWRYHGGEWNALETRIAGESADSYRFVAESPGLSVFAVRAGPADLDVTGASVGSTDLAVGESVTLSATVANDGASGGTTSVPFVVGDQEVAERSVTVPPGDERTVTVTYTPESAGEFDVVVGNVSAAALSVTERDEGTTTREPGTDTPGDDGQQAGDESPDDGGGPPIEEPAGFSPLTVGALAVVLGAMLALFLLARRRA